MRFDFLQQGLDTLGKSHFGKMWPEASIRVIALEIAEISDQALVATVARIRVEISPATFPALKRVVDILKEEQVKINLSKSPAESKSRRENDVYWSRFGEKAGEHAMRTMALWRKLDELTPDQIVEVCQRMDREYPGVGWHDTTMFYIRRARGEEVGLQAA